MLKEGAEEGGEQAVKEGAEKGAGALSATRQEYIREVEALKDVAAEMRAAGKSPEEIAPTLHKMRRDIGIKYKI